MRKIGMLSIALLLMVSAYAQNYNLGAELTLTEITKISDILKDKDSFLGKRVLVEAEILQVCEANGCWIELKSDDEDMLRVKVRDGEIVFPVEAKGKTALVEGELYKVEMDHETAIKYFKHLADDAGREFDPSTVTGSYTLYQLKGIGAVIKEFSLED